MWENLNAWYKEWKRRREKDERGSKNEMLWVFKVINSDVYVSFSHVVIDVHVSFSHVVTVKWGVSHI
jgi:hypothetical protein